MGDLAVEFELENRGPTGSVTIDLVEAGLRHRCTIDLTDGRVELVPAGATGATAVEAVSRVTGRGRWRILFANVDDELRLFVDGRAVPLAAPVRWERTFESALGARPVAQGGEIGDEEPGDLSPVGITATAADLTVKRLRVLRDVYYIASGDVSALAGRTPEEEFLGFPLAAGQFFMLGDNSSASKDSRAWGSAQRPLYHVDRHLLIGRAVLIFWPHAIPARWSIPVRIGGMEVRLPCWPNFGRMGFVR